MKRFPIEMGHVPDEQLQLMSSFIGLRREWMQAARQGPAARDMAKAQGAEDLLTAEIEAAEGR